MIEDAEGIFPIMSIDIGESTDHTAISIIYPVYTDHGMEYHVKHIERLPLKIKYGRIMQRIKDISAENHHAMTIVIDQTGVGKPVVDLIEADLSKLGVEVIGVTITKGYNINGWNIPKKYLISSLKAGLQTKKVKIARNLIEPEILEITKNELLNYREDTKKLPAEDALYDNWRNGEHDDIVLSLSIGIFAASMLYPEV